LRPNRRLGLMAQGAKLVSRTRDRGTTHMFPSLRAKRSNPEAAEKDGIASSLTLLAMTAVATRCAASGASKKGGPEKPSLCRCRSCRAEARVTSPPLPARRPTCLTPPVRSPALGENRRSCADTSRFGRSANRIVNLTLTPQTPGQTGAKPPAAWTLQGLSCTTNRGRRLCETGTDMSLHAPAQVRAFKI
jgi:hypothetical protein